MATEEELYRMSDEDLEAAFLEAKAELDSPETDIEVEPEEIDEEVEDLEQPEEDSDDDTSSEEDDEEELEEDSETEEDDPDEDSDEEDEQTDEDEDESDEEEQKAQDDKLVFRADGREYEFTTEEMKAQFGKVFGQAMNYTKKMQQLKPWRKTIDAIEQANLTDDDINLAIDVLNGDKDAIASLLNRKGIDALELDVDNSNYVPKDYGRNATELAIKDVVDEIKDDPEYETTYTVLEKQWDDSSRDAFIQNPEMIRQLHVDVKSGMFDTIAPIANKMKVFDGGSKSDLDYYKMAAQQYFDEVAQYENDQKVANERVEEEKTISRVKTATRKREATKATSAKRKAAAPTGKRAGTSKVIDYLDTSDEAFEDWYNKLQDSV